MFKKTYVHFEFVLKMLFVLTLFTSMAELWLNISWVISWHMRMQFAFYNYLCFVLSFYFKLLYTQSFSLWIERPASPLQLARLGCGINKQATFDMTVNMIKPKLTLKSFFSTGYNYNIHKSTVNANLLQPYSLSKLLLPHNLQMWCIFHHTLSSLHMSYYKLYLYMQKHVSYFGNTLF